YLINKVRNQALGYYWSFTNKFELKTNLSAVAKYTDDGTFIESYSSVKEAAKANNLKSGSAIIHAIRGTQKHAAGFRWRYFYGNTDNIKPL
ncbi:MAG: hypothetical protein HUJ56_03405, partial [Erysipelotrichaceae bacterium]|nr:hypothetical protein [Erysipelotrichaceae bacterium]